LPKYPESSAMKVREVFAEIEKDLGRALKEVSEAQIEDMVSKILGSRQIFLFGEGRSGLIARAFAMRLMQLGLKAYFVGETITPSIGTQDLLIICSGSGQSPVSYQIARTARKAGAGLFLITSSPQSPIGRLSQGYIKLTGPRKRAPAGLKTIQPLGSVFEQAMLILLDAVVVLLKERRKIREEDMLARHANL